MTGGTPTVLILLSLPLVSTTAAKYVGTLGKLLAITPIASIKTVIEIGGGLGGMAWMLAHLPDVTSVIVYDLPETSACIANIVKKCTKIACLPCGAPHGLQSADLVLSEHAWSECPAAIRAEYAASVFAIAKRGWLTCNYIPAETAIADIQDAVARPTLFSPAEVFVSHSSYTIVW